MPPASKSAPPAKDEPAIEVKTAPFDARFPNQNQTRLKQCLEVIEYF